MCVVGRCDKDLDGRITGEEVKEVIMLSASANKLSKLKDQAAEYAALIMEELDVDRTGYIEVLKLFNLFVNEITNWLYSISVKPTKSILTWWLSMC